MVSDLGGSVYGLAVAELNLRAFDQIFKSFPHNLQLEGLSLAECLVLLWLDGKGDVPYWSQTVFHLAVSCAAQMEDTASAAQPQPAPGKNNIPGWLQRIQEPPNDTLKVLENLCSRGILRSFKRQSPQGLARLVAGKKAPGYFFVEDALIIAKLQSLLVAAAESANPEHEAAALLALCYVADEHGALFRGVFLPSALGAKEAWVRTQAKEMIRLAVRQSKPGHGMSYNEEKGRQEEAEDELKRASAIYEKAKAAIHDTATKAKAKAKAAIHDKADRAKAAKAVYGNQNSTFFQWPHRSLNSKAPCAEENQSKALEQSPCDSYPNLLQWFRRSHNSKAPCIEENQAKALEPSPSDVYPYSLERKPCICSCAGQWVVTETTATPVLEINLRDPPHDRQRVLGDVFEINDLGLLFDISHDHHSLLGAVTIKDCMLSQVDMEGAEHTAAMTHFSKDHDGKTFPQMLRWNNGEVWTRKRSELEDRDHENSEVLSSAPLLEEVDCSMISATILGKPFDEDSNLQGVIPCDEDGSLQDLLAHLQNRDREIQEALSSLEVVEEPLPPPCSIVSAAISGKAFDEHGDLQALLAHVQNRDREIQEALSSVEEVHCSMVSAAILGKPFETDGNLQGVIAFDEDGNLQGVVEL